MIPHKFLKMDYPPKEFFFQMDPWQRVRYKVHRWVHMASLYRFRPLESLPWCLGGVGWGRAVEYFQGQSGKVLVIGRVSFSGI